MIWFLGDNKIQTDVESFAASQQQEIVSSVHADATMEQVWSEQLYDPIIRPHLIRRQKAGPLQLVMVVCLFGNHDVEGTISRILTRVPYNSMFIYVHSKNLDSASLDGFTHFDGLWLKHAPVGDKTLSEMYNET